MLQNRYDLKWGIRMQKVFEYHNVLSKFGISAGIEKKIIAMLTNEKFSNKKYLNNATFEPLPRHIKEADFLFYFCL